MSIISQAIPNMNAPMNDVQRIVHINGLVLSDDSKEMFIHYKIQYLKNEIDITQALSKDVRPIYIHNNMTVYQRNLEDFSKVRNPEFVDLETTPETLEFLEAPAYDYITGIFKQHPEMIWFLLTGYILENYSDGWFENI